MVINVGTLDKWIRGVIVVALIAVGLWVGDWYQWILYGLALMLTITIFTGFCFLYRLVGIQTCPIKK